MNRQIAILTLSLLTASFGRPADAGSRRNVDIPERFQGAERTVVARVVHVRPVMVRNAWGDELIVSHARLQVEEVLKGTSAPELQLDVEGGTLGDLTLHVSDLPDISVGERGVFFVARSREGRNVPHLRGLGILKLDAANRVPGSSLTLDMIRTMAHGAAVR